MGARDKNVDGKVDPLFSNHHSDPNLEEGYVELELLALAFFLRVKLWGLEMHGKF